MNRAFHALAEAIVPETSALTPAEWQAFDSIIADALAKRPAGMRRQLGIFIRLLNVISLFRFGKPLHLLELPKRTQFLAGIQDSRLLLFRRGFWGVRTLVFMGYYARPEAAALIGYAASPRGWERYK